MDQNELKKLVGRKAVTFIQDNTVVGLGTGSTVKFMVDALGERVKNEHLHIVGVPTSNRTAEQAKALGIEVKSVDEVDHIDLTIDGADEISADYQGIKGGGAAHLFEKIVATNSDKVMWIVDESKMVKTLGKFPLPLEVIPYGSQQVLKKLAAKGLHPEFRLDENGNHVLTDSKNYVIDLHLGQIEHPHKLADYLIKQVGIVEQGLFLDMVNTIIVGRQNGPEVIQARP
ncbi:ribose-5-phosphate isomerase RpiA [Pediococcus cellicola]|uniref:Ribose-5-phosphate isomerase A n=1 Tax=Pediococcus cellicola TaxID=319652 RepID=A0A0R2IY24_9LACO|nr:ribose-5-phosphate isomerase RpiA [Pediococcus cellicola]KRN66762.1 ribose-5-phosphate isomerase A [Pediococcus cellicola]GEL14592.1 ribose-5-phosphate isomerase A [Pediococcus cellicola]